MPKPPKIPRNPHLLINTPFELSRDKAGRSLKRRDIILNHEEIGQIYIDPHHIDFEFFPENVKSLSKLTRDGFARIRVKNAPVEKRAPLYVRHNQDVFETKERAVKRVQQEFDVSEKQAEKFVEEAIKKQGVELK